MPSFWIFLLHWCAGFLEIILSFTGLINYSWRGNLIAFCAMCSFACDYVQQFFWVYCSMYPLNDSENTHALPLKFMQLIFYKFIICYKFRRETNTVKQHCYQTRKTLCLVFLITKYVTVWKSSIKGIMSTDLLPSLLFFSFLIAVFKNIK